MLKYIYIIGQLGINCCSLFYFKDVNGKVGVVHLFTFVSKISCNRLKNSIFVLWYITVWPIESSPPLFIEVNIPSQESDRSCIRSLAKSILPLPVILPMDFWIAFRLFLIFRWTNIWIYQPLKDQFSWPTTSTVISRYCIWRLQYINWSMVCLHHFLLHRI
jgi:hypothetical protein